MLRTGRTIRSAKMNATTPPKLMPPFHRTAASGTLPIEQTNETTATSGPTSGPQSLAASGWPSRKKPCQKCCGTHAASAPATSRPTAMSTQTDAQSITKYWLVAVNPAGERSPEQQGEEGDHQRPADELGHGELPAEQHREDDAQLDHQVGGGELEGHRGGEVGALAEDRAGQGDRGVGARRGRRAKPAGGRQRAGRVVGQQPAHLGLGDDRLHRPGQGEAEDQRPEDLPEHRERERERVPDGTQHRPHASLAGATASQAIARTPTSSSWPLMPPWLLRSAADVPLLRDVARRSGARVVRAALRPTGWARRARRRGCAHRSVDGGHVPDRLGHASGQMGVPATLTTGAVTAASSATRGTATTRTASRSVAARPVGGGALSRRIRSGAPEPPAPRPTGAAASVASTATVSARPWRWTAASSAASSTRCATAARPALAAGSQKNPTRSTSAASRRR